MDLFALGVILFFMRAGYYPFQKATEEDPFYKLLINYRSDHFWTAHTQKVNKGQDYFSEEFKDLITCMLQRNASERLCTTDAVGHPWNQGGAS